MTAAHKKKKRMHKKAPTAPKRGKSPYILFSMERREDIKSRLHPDAGVTEVRTVGSTLFVNQGYANSQPDTSLLLSALPNQSSPR